MNITETIKSVRLFILVPLFLSACGTDPNQASEEPEPELATDTTSAGITAWGTTWSGAAPVVCDSGSMVSKAWCGGSNCSSTAIYCLPLYKTTGYSYWTRFVSEEQGPDGVVCPGDEFMTGITCRGNLCDDVSIQCTSFPGIQFDDCHWLNRFSEEQDGYSIFGEGYVAAGVSCYGNNCDDMRYHVCKIN